MLKDKSMFKHSKSMAVKIDANKSKGKDHVLYEEKFT